MENSSYGLEAVKRQRYTLRLLFIITTFSGCHTMSRNVTQCHVYVTFMSRFVRDIFSCSSAKTMFSRQVLLNKIIYIWCYRSLYIGKIDVTKCHEMSRNVTKCHVYVTFMSRFVRDIFSCSSAKTMFSRQVLLNKIIYIWCYRSLYIGKIDVTKCHTRVTQGHARVTINGLISRNKYVLGRT